MKPTPRRDLERKKMVREELFHLLNEHLVASDPDYFVQGQEYAVTAILSRFNVTPRRKPK